MRPLMVAAMGLLATACSWHDPLGPLAPITTSSGNRPTAGGGPSVADATAVAIGDRVEGTVKPDDPHCWPDWDSSGVCRVYSVVAKEAGTLTATLSWSGGEEMDVFFFLGEFLGERGGPVWERNSKPQVTVLAGQTIAIAVMSYKAPQAFVLETGVQP
jgi:hypothetical protein